MPNDNELRTLPEILADVVLALEGTGYEHYAHELQSALATAAPAGGEVDALRDAAAELLRLKKLKDRLAAMSVTGRADEALWLHQTSEYEHAKPRAWAALEAALHTPKERT